MLVLTGAYNNHVAVAAVVEIVYYYFLWFSLILLVHNETSFYCVLMVYASAFMWSTWLCLILKANAVCEAEPKSGTYIVYSYFSYEVWI